MRIRPVDNLSLDLEIGRTKTSLMSKSSELQHLGAGQL